MAEKGPKKFSRFMRHGTRGDQVEKRRPGRNRQPGRKKEARKKWQKKAEKIFALYAPFPYYYYNPSNDTIMVDTSISLAYSIAFH